MEVFGNIINSANGIIWSMALVVLLVAVGIFFTIATKAIQFRRFGDMWRLLGEKHEDSEAEGLSSFQAFATTVGARVGMGNIAGVATAIFFGGPGAVVWMWIVALLGMATACIETTLGQAYKEKSKGEYIGGPQYYAKSGLGSKVLGIVFAISAIVALGFLCEGVQSSSLAMVVESSFGVPHIVTAIVLCVVLFVVISGGIQRIGKIAEWLSPIMCLIFLVVGIAILIIHIKDVPEAIGVMFKSAFAAESMYAGIFGATVSWGVKRGLFSNEAGMGTGVIVSSSAECSHPAKQGLVQSASVFIDTMIVCSITGISILITGMYNVSDAAGNMITEGIPGVEYGINWMQQAMVANLGGSWAGALLTILVVVFVFTSLMAFYYMAESNTRYIFGDKQGPIYVLRGVFLLGCLLGVMVENQVVWNMADTGCGIMAWLNLIFILVLAPCALRIIKDYDKQKKLGLDPLFDPATVGIKDQDGVWNSYVEKKKARGDYENPDLGYSERMKD